MLDFDTTMALGRAQYQDVIDALTAAGLPTSFTQTGGMNAALEVRLDGGHALLVTDAEDSLSWARAEHAGWAVALYAPEQAYDGEVSAFDTTEDGSVAGLRELVDRVLRAAARG